MDNRSFPIHLPLMRPVDMQVIGTELAVKWDDGRETFVSLERLRRACPCAMCRGEADVLGRWSAPPPQSLTAASFILRDIRIVGSYGLQPVWADGHATGIYSFEYLIRLGESSDSPCPDFLPFS